MKITKNTKPYKEDSDLWEDGTLGRIENAQQLSAEEDQAIDTALGLQLISIRLQKQLIEDLKVIAIEEGITYQPLIRQILTRHVKSLKKKEAARAK